MIITAFGCFFTFIDLPQFISLYERSYHFVTSAGQWLTFPVRAKLSICGLWRLWPGLFHDFLLQI